MKCSWSFSDMVTMIKQMLFLFIYFCYCKNYYQRKIYYLILVLFFALFFASELHEVCFDEHVDVAIHYGVDV